MTSLTERIAPEIVQELLPEYDVERIREDFPILKQVIHGKSLVYLDNANTTQKPQLVLGDAGLRDRAAEGAAFPQRGPARRDHLRPQRH
jgi:hypothetical protein